MNWKEYCKGFAIQKDYCEWEGKSLIYVASYHKIPFCLVTDPEKVPEGWVPSGTVEWVSKVLGKTMIPDYFPYFLKRWVTRNVWKQDIWPLKRVFIKPADRYKRFTGFVTSGTEEGKEEGPFWCSDIVSFQEEWRYYISYGKLIGAYWYLGTTDTPIVAPTLDIKWPSDWCGTADFGILPDGKIELVEAHPPFACGWYGKKHEEYAEFLTLGWKYLNGG